MSLSPSAAVGPTVALSAVFTVGAKVAAGDGVASPSTTPPAASLVATEGAAEGAADVAAVGATEAVTPPSTAPAGAIVGAAESVVVSPPSAAAGAGEPVAAAGAGVPAAPPATVSPQKRSTPKPSRLSGPWKASTLSMPNAQMMLVLSPGVDERIRWVPLGVKGRVKASVVEVSFWLTETAVISWSWSTSTSPKF